MSLFRNDKTTTPSPPTKSFPIESPWGKLSGRLPIRFNGHDNSHPLELRVCLSQTLRNPNSYRRTGRIEQLLWVGSVGCTWRAWRDRSDCIYIYIYIYIWMYVCMYVSMYLCMYVALVWGKAIRARARQGSEKAGKAEWESEGGRECITNNYIFQRRSKIINKKFYNYNLYIYVLLFVRAQKRPGRRGAGAGRQKIGEAEREGM